MKNKTLLWTIVVLVFLAVWGFTAYNGMVTQEETVDQTWANVQNQYQRRYDLIPNLVNTVKGYSEHESATFQKVTEARAGLLAAQDNARSVIDPQNNMAAFQEAQGKLKGALDIYVNAVHEAYPELKANENFMNLQTQLEGTENRIATERKRYNDAVRDYNIKIRRFPGSIVAGISGFEKKDPFAAEEQAQTAPKVQF